MPSDNVPPSPPHQDLSMYTSGKQVPKRNREVAVPYESREKSVKNQALTQDVYLQRLENARERRKKGGVTNVPRSKFKINSSCNHHVDNEHHSTTRSRYWSI